jgi:hypothetical protein
MYVTSFDSLPDEVVAYISTFLDSNDLFEFSNVNRSFQSIQRQALDLVGNTPNSTVYSFQSFMENGPIFMKYLRSIQLYQFAKYVCPQYESRFKQFLSEGLLSLQVPLVRRELSLDIESLDLIFAPFQNVFESRIWNSVQILCKDFGRTLSFRCRHANLHQAHTYVRHNIQVLDSLQLHDVTRSSLDPQGQSALAIQKLFSKHLTLHTLSIYGMLTQDLLETLKRSGTIQPSIRHLHLYNQLPEVWPLIKNLQVLLPNLETLSIRDSNLIAKDIEYIDWSLWPKIRNLGFQQNWTLECSQLYVPQGLNSLYLDETIHDATSCANLLKKQSLTSLSVHLDITEAWTDFFKHHGRGLKTLYMTKKHTLDSILCEEFWKQLVHLDMIVIVSYHRTKSLDRQLGVVRTWLPNTFVKLVCNYQLYL